MKFVRIILFAALCLVAQTALHAQTTPKQRAVIWLKGFATEESGFPGWAQYNSLFSTQRYMKGLQPRYFTDRTIDSIAALTRSTMDSLLLIARADTTLSIEPPIVVGHSMGGLVARSMERLNRIQTSPQQFGGIITVGTPNQGSELNRSLRDGLMRDMLERTLSTFTTVFSNGRGTSLRMTPIPLYISVQNPSMTDIYQELLHKRLDSTFLRLGANAREDGKSADAFTDMIPESSFLTSLNAPSQPQDTLPMISIQCTANYPTLYRMVHSFAVSRPHLAAIDQHNDDGLTKEIYKTASFMLAVSSALSLLYVEGMYTPQQLIQDPTAVLVAAGENNYFAEALIRPWRMLKYDLPAGFCTLMGSAQYQYRTIAAWRARLPDGADGKPVFAYEQRGEAVPIITDTDDGTLWRESQIHPNRRDRTFDALGANHVSALNHRSVRLRLEQFFTSERDFLVTPRNP